MAYRSTYTSSMTFPITLKWKCSKCGSNNSKETTMTAWSSITTSNRKFADEMKEDFQKSWVKDTITIIEDPSKTPEGFRNSVNTNACYCSSCKKAEFWTTKQWYFKILSFLFLPAIISLIAVIAAPASWKSWLAFIIFDGSLIATFLDEKIFNAKLRKISSDLKPQIIAHNEDIIEYAERNKINIIIPENTVVVDESKADVISDVNNQIESLEKALCPKCGKELKSGSIFCSYCGTDLSK